MNSIDRFDHFGAKQGFKQAHTGADLDIVLCLGQGAPSEPKLSASGLSGILLDQIKKDLKLSVGLIDPKPSPLRRAKFHPADPNPELQSLIANRVYRGYIGIMEKKMETTI